MMLVLRGQGGGTHSSPAVTLRKRLCWQDAPQGPGYRHVPGRFPENLSGSLRTCSPTCWRLGWTATRRAPRGQAAPSPLSPRLPGPVPAAGHLAGQGELAGSLHVSPERTGNTRELGGAAPSRTFRTQVEKGKFHRQPPGGPAVPPAGTGGVRGAPLAVGCQAGAPSGAVCWGRASVFPKTKPHV